MTVEFTTLDGGSVAIGRRDLTDRLTAPLVFPDSPDYDSSRSVWNGMIDRTPSVIVRCRAESDVSAAVQFAAERRISLAIRSGGHNIAGSALIDRGLVIDLRAIRHVDVDPAARSARVGAGATLGDVDDGTQAFGLAVPTGINSTTGIAGLTLGGGIGWTTRKLGLTIDNLRSARVVTADGEVVTASAEDNPDLFWAIRGGGGNFGVVTEFEFNLHPLGPEVVAGMAVHPLDDAESVIEAYQPRIADAPDELTCWAVLRKAPPLPFLPESWHGREVMVLAMCCIGDLAAGEQATRRFREIGRPIAESVGPMPFKDWQKTFDPLLKEGARNYWKTHDVSAFDANAARAIRAAVAELPSDECEVFVGQIGGQATRVPTEQTAWPNREAHYVVNLHTRWQSAADDNRCIAWAQSLYDRLMPSAMGSRYVNFIVQGEEGNVRDLYGENFKRLAAIKATRDPSNLFRSNINIAP